MPPLPPARCKQENRIAKKGAPAMTSSPTAPLRETAAPAATMAAPGDWPGPALTDFLYPAQVVGC